MSLINNVYQAFINQGLSPNQAKIITAEVGRENDFQPQYVFGRHVDASNGKVNLGMISWQGGRGTALDKRLRAKGLIGGNGIVRSQAALNEMANFLVGEIKSNPAYAVTKKAFLNNPNVSYDVGKKVLGQNFIRWDYSGKAVLGNNVGKHHAKRDKYYRQIGGQGGSNYQPQQGGQQQAPQRDPRLDMDAPSLLANLRKANSKQSGVELMYALTHSNGKAGREINMLLQQGESLDSIAGQLGVKVPQAKVSQQPQQAADPLGDSYEQYMGSIEPQSAPQADSDPLGGSYEDYMGGLMAQDSEPQAQPMQAQAQPQSERMTSQAVAQQQEMPVNDPLGDSYEEYMSSLSADPQNQQAVNNG